MMTEQVKLDKEWFDLVEIGKNYVTIQVRYSLMIINKKEVLQAKKVWPE